MAIGNQSKIRLDIQGLRAISVLFVLLFHLWRREFPCGHLGVDIFFCISGYLMFSVLSKLGSINLSKIFEFYFRRLRRIVPTYLFVIFVVLILIYSLLPPTEFKDVVTNAIPSLFFVSNIVKIQRDSYFDLRSQYRFFLHTWSLSCELQFYSIAPLLFLVIKLGSKAKPMIGGFIICLFLLGSFLYQTLYSSEHTDLVGRLWQFFCGFLACYWRQLTDGNSNRKHTLKANRRNRANEYVQLVCLVVPLVFNFGETSIFNRKIALFVVTLILGQQKENTLLANKLLVKIGNWSYSIYLIHWPLFTLHRFIFADLYQNEAEPEFFVGFLLISISLFLGWITESTFDAVSKWICTWTCLLLVLVLGFLFNFFLLNQLKHNAADIFTEAKPSNEWKIQFRQQLYAIQANQNQTLPINKLIELNANMIRYSMTFSECGDESDALPSRFKINITYMQYICHEKGAGTKNMLLVGNSHAAFNFPGIKHVFKDVCKTLTVIGRDSCYPAPVEFQQKHTAQIIKNYCVNLMLKELFLVLEQWHQKIDILIVLIGYSRTKDVPINGDIKKDPLFKSMQNFYKRLSKIPKQVMFIQNQHMSFEQKPARKLVNRLKFGKPAGQIGNSLQYQLSQYSQINQRIKAVNCGKKCLKLDWTKIWCSSKDFCSAIDSTKKISYFIDENHPSWFGSIRQAKYMRQLYDSFVKNTTKE